MKLNIILKQLFLVSIFLLTTIVSVNAQDQNTFEMSLSPAIQELQIGESYEVTVFNETDEDTTVLLEPVIIYFEDSNRNTYSFVDNDTVKPEDYVSISQEEVFVEANSTAKVSAQYKQSLSGFVPGVKISKIIGQDSNLISTNPEIVSLILDYKFNEADVLGISTSLRSSLDVELFSIAVGNKFKLTTEIYNDSKKLVKPTGEIEVFEGEIRIGNISLTQKIKKSLLPGESIKIESEFIDVRGPWDRLGRLTFKQRLEFADQTVRDEASLFVVPYQVVLYLIALTLILAFGIRIFLKRKELILYKGISTPVSSKKGKNNDKKI